MSSGTILIIAAAISSIIGIKKPIFGGISGAILAPILHLLFSDFNLVTFIIYIPVGFLFGYGFAFVASLLYSGSKGKPQSSGPSVIGQSGGHRFSEHTGGIILSDEEREGIKPPKGKPRPKK